MAAPTVHLSHEAFSANRCPHCVSWSRGDVLACGTSHSIVLYSPQKRTVLSTLNGHTGRVNCVQWIREPDCSAETELVSGGSDKKVIVWRIKDYQLVHSEVLDGHTEAVCAVHAVRGTSQSAHALLVASAASDCTVRIWRRQKSTTECLQSLSFGNGFVLDVCLSVLPGSGGESGCFMSSLTKLMTLK
ncbi:hypothetical protein GDO78_012837 [Eleutherodactylus coqui]|uniref:Elongator complex protein 2 n=1 Tax=Eleutherodactylus coqui TaxID=57060 RepID=A0A8J6K4F3_ELECQ|nr:hypothetical protein GDO78_012837 [Eleutherodactylus coqui]